MNLSDDYITFSIILDANGFTEIKGSTTETTYFRNNYGNVLTVNKIKNYDDNYLSELADQAGYDMDSLINTFRIVKKVKQAQQNTN